MFLQWDYSFFQLINHLAVSEKFLDPFMIFLSEKAQYLFFAAILFYWFYRRTENRQMVVEACLSACIALAINGLIGMAFYRDRPFVAHHVNWLIPHVKNASFPSDHATAAFVIAMSIWIWRKRDGWLWLILAAGIALSRVWTGVHYPSDVVAGMIIGVCVAGLVHYAVTKVKVLGRLVSFVISLYEKVENRLFKKMRIN